jgi:hypothetical protein
MPLLDVAASGKHQDEGAKPMVMKGPLDDVLGDAVELEELVQPEIDQQVQAGIEEGVTAPASGAAAPASASR